MAATLTHGRVDKCTCHGQAGRKVKWLGEGHAEDCPARQPEDPHGCTCAGRKPPHKEEGHAHDCPAGAKVRGV